VVTIVDITRICVPVLLCAIVVIFLLYILFRRIPQVCVLTMTPREFEILEAVRVERSSNVTPPKAIPYGQAQFEEGYWTPTSIYVNGIRSDFGGVQIEILGRGREGQGTFVVTKKYYEFVPFSDLSGIFPIEVEDPSTGPVEDRRRTTGLQVETLDLRTGLLYSNDRFDELHRILRLALGTRWKELYHESVMLEGTLERWELGHEKSTSLLVATGDLFRHQVLRDADPSIASGEPVVWNGKKLSVLEMLKLNP
jgi:hypothetical protein